MYAREIEARAAAGRNGMDVNPGEGLETIEFAKTFDTRLHKGSDTVCMAESR